MSELKERSRKFADLGELIGCLVVLGEIDEQEPEPKTEGNKGKITRARTALDVNMAKAAKMKVQLNAATSQVHQMLTSIQKEEDRCVAK